MTPHQAAVIERYQAGEGLSAIARSAGVTRQRIDQIVAAAGVVRHPRRRPQLTTCSLCTVIHPAHERMGHKRSLEHQLALFLSHVPDRPAVGCWIHDGDRYPFGYARGYFAGQQDYAHRIAWILANGPIPNGLFVCHTCDNPPCCRPDHLFLGTAADNAHDRDQKGRGKGSRP